MPKFFHRNKSRPTVCSWLTIFQTLIVSEEVLFYLTYPSITQTRGCMATITKYIGMFSIMSLGNCSGVFSFFQTCEFLSWFETHSKGSDIGRSRHDKKKVKTRPQKYLSKNAQWCRVVTHTVWPERYTENIYHETAARCMVFNHKYLSSAICPTSFIRRGTWNTNSKEHCMCIKEKQNISSQSFFRSCSHFYTPFWYLWPHEGPQTIGSFALAKNIDSVRLWCDYQNNNNLVLIILT